MRIGLVQMHSIPGEVETNVEKGRQYFREAAQNGCEVVAYPELWTGGYYLEHEGFLAAARKTPHIVERFKALAKEYAVLTILPAPQEKNGNLYIGLFVIERDGTILAEYQKSYLWGREQNYFVRGKRRYEPVETSLGKIGVLICYDIEFPEPARALAKRGAELIFVPSVWSVPAANRWHIQLPARALDNTVFIAGINNVQEGACGASKIVSPMGDIIAQASGDQEEVLVADIDLAAISRTRKIVPYLQDLTDEEEA